MGPALTEDIEGGSDLQQGFATFVEAARRLEQSYAELKQRADAVDLELADTNRELERTLAERETVFRALPVGVVATDPHAAVVWCNREGERLREAAARAACDLQAAGPGQLEIDGLTVRVGRVPLPDGGTLLVLEDRTRVVHLEHEVHRLDRLAGLSELALGVAHEIKNPLNGVMGFASLMQRSEDPDQLHGFAEKVVQGLKQVDEIVRAMLAFARPEQARAVMASVEEIVASASAQAGLPASRIRLSGDKGAVAESSALTRVLTNLLRNSIEAGGASVEVSVDVCTCDHDIELRVRDNGPGVDADLGDRIFEPFVSSKQLGHGLGLALAARVLAFLGGSVELVDDGSPGATFLVRVPREDSA